MQSLGGFGLITNMAIEFPAGESLLASGRHAATVEEVEAALVEDFPSSTRRRPLLERWLAVREAIRRIVQVETEWLDGSYVSREEEPGDIDMLSHFDAAEVDGLDDPSKAMLAGLVAGDVSRELHLCHSFVLVVYPEGHPAHGVYQQWRQYWEDLFGHDRSGQPKGFLEVA